MDYGTIHYVHASAASITDRKSARNSSLDHVYHSFSLHLFLSPSLCYTRKLPVFLGESGNGARYLQRVIRKAATAQHHRQAVLHVFIRFPIKREIFQFWYSNFCRSRFRLRDACARPKTVRSRADMKSRCVRQYLPEIAPINEWLDDNRERSQTERGIIPGTAPWIIPFLWMNSQRERDNRAAISSS